MTVNRPSPVMAQDLVICEHCDAVFARPALDDGQSADCARCGAQLYRNPRTDINGLYALASASLLVFVIANASPIVRVEISGEHNETTLLGAVIATWQSGVSPVAALAWACAFFFPLTQILACLYIAIPLRQQRRPRHFRAAMHVLHWLTPWSMLEVFMLGTLVALVKLGSYAVVVTGVGLWAFAVLTLLLTLLGSSDLHALWRVGARAAAHTLT